MPSNLSSIGFPVESEEEFNKLVEEAYKNSKAIISKNGTYHLLSSECGAELWLQVNKGNDLVGLNPHYRGSSLVRVGLTARINRPDDSGLDGAFHGWADPEGDEMESGLYPFVFDCPDADCILNMKLPQIVEVQLSAFAHEISVYNTVEEYDEAQKEEMKFAPKSFIPSGLFSPEGEASNPPEAMAIFSGEIIESKMQTNAFSQHQYFWAKVSTLGGVFDVVADPESINGPIKPGGILSGSFWISGRILDFQKEQPKSFLKRLFWKQ